MTTFKKELEKILSIKDESALQAAFQKFCRQNGDRLPLPGEDTRFDKAMWAASQYMPLSGKDEDILRRVTGKLLGETVGAMESAVETAVLRLKDLVGSTREAAVASWQDMLSAMAWQQMVPAGAMRGVGTQMVSLGTFQKELAEANVQLNLGWLVDQDQLRILLQAKDSQDKAIPEVEVRVKEIGRGVVFSRKSNQDGTIVAPAVKIGPGQYQIEVSFMGETAETPYFVI